MMSLESLRGQVAIAGVGHAGLGEAQGHTEMEVLAQVLATIRQFHAAHGELWRPAPLLERLVAQGQTFADL